MTTETTYQSASRHLLAQARAELASGDLRQASEKGWEAAAQMVKAVAEQRGWEHQSHAALYSTIRRLRVNHRNEDIRRWFQVAGSLHTNFHENWEESGSIEEGLNDVERLVDALEPLLS